VRRKRKKKNWRGRGWVDDGWMDLWTDEFVDEWQQGEKGWGKKTKGPLKSVICG